MPRLQPPHIEGGASLGGARIKTGRSIFRENGRLAEFETMFYARNLLPVDQPFAGPAIVLQNDSTTVIPPGHSAMADAFGSMIIRIGGQS